MGGISRYSRYQVTAWRELLAPESVRVLSLLGPDEASFEEPFHVDFTAHGVTARAKAAFVARALAEAATWRPDVIHVAHLHLSALARALAFVARGRSVINIYGVEVWSGAGFESAWGLRSADFVISDSHFTADYVTAHGMRLGRPMVVINDCVDVARFSPGKPRPEVVSRYRLPDPETGVNLMSLGRISSDAAHKGFERLVSVFAALAPRFPHLRLILAGRGDLVETLQRLAASHGLSERVHFPGRIRDADLPDVYRAAHVFSLAGDRGVDRGEGVPLTPLEAAACGIPVIVGNQDGSVEAAVDGETGFVIDPFDLARHAECVSALITQPALRNWMGEKARARIVTAFSFAGFVQRHRDLMTTFGSPGRPS